jgi:hypothetical protein
VLSGKKTEPFKQLLETRARVVLGPVTLEADAEMVTDARFLSLHSPELRIEAIFGLEDFHTTPLTLVQHICRFAGIPRTFDKIPFLHWE